MLMKFRCYLHDDDTISKELRKKFVDSGRDLSLMEYDTMLNTDHIVSLEEKKLLDTRMNKLRTPIVVATMTTGKTFFIKAKSIPELQLKSVINGKGDLS